MLAMPPFITYLDMPTNIAIYEHGMFIVFFTVDGISRSSQLIAYNRDFVHEAQSSCAYTRA